MGKRTRSQRKEVHHVTAASHRFPGSNTMPRVKDVVGEVTELVHSPVHTAPLARVKLPDGQTNLVVATEGISIGSTVAIGDNVALRPGNITSISNIPEGTAINNLEIRPGDGGKIARTAGNSATRSTPRWWKGTCQTTFWCFQGHVRKLQSNYWSSSRTRPWRNATTNCWCSTLQGKGPWKVVPTSVVLQ